MIKISTTQYNYNYNNIKATSKQLGFDLIVISLVVNQTHTQNMFRKKH